jgi:hypothetical protein
MRRPPCRACRHAGNVQGSRKSCARQVSRSRNRVYPAAGNVPIYAVTRMEAAHVENDPCASCLDDDRIHLALSRRKRWGRRRWWRRLWRRRLRSEQLLQHLSPRSAIKILPDWHVSERDESGSRGSDRALRAPLRRSADQRLLTSRAGAVRASASDMFRPDGPLDFTTNSCCKSRESRVTGMSGNGLLRNHLPKAVAEQAHGA